LPNIKGEGGDGMSVKSGSSNRRYKKQWILGKRGLAGKGAGKSRECRQKEVRSPGGPRQTGKSKTARPTPGEKNTPGSAVRQRAEM